MLDYNQINSLFGAPLDTVPKPRMPFKLKPWHILVGTAAAYLIYRGVKSMTSSPLITPVKSKDIDRTDSALDKS